VCQDAPGANGVVPAGDGIRGRHGRQVLEPGNRPGRKVRDDMDLVGIVAAVGPGLNPVPPADVLFWVLFEIALILIAARIVGGIFVRFNQPRVVGEIVSGILLGPSLLGLEITNKLWAQQPLPVIQRLGDIALLFFMFLVGMELDVKLLRGRERQIAVVAVAVVAIPIILGFLIAPTPWLDKPAFRPAGVSASAYAMFLGAGLAVTAFPVMAHMLMERRQLGTTMGAIGVGSAAAITVLMFIAIAAASAIARGQGLSDFKLAGPPYSPGQAAVMTVLFIAVLVFIVRPILTRLTQGYDPDRGISLEFLAITLILMFLSGVVGERIGITQWVGSFLFGTVVPTWPGLRRDIANRMKDFTIVLLVPIFLAYSGIRTNLRLLEWSLVPGIALFLAMMVVGKLGVGTLASRAVGLKWRQSLLLGTLLNCRGLLILAVALKGLELGVITPQMQLIFVMGAIITTMMTGPLANVFTEPGETRPTVQEMVPVEQRTALTVTPPPGVRRVLVAVGNPANAPGLIKAGRALAGNDAPVELVLVRLVPLPELVDFRSGVNDAALDVAQTLKELRALAEASRNLGATAVPLAFQSPDIAGDLVRLCNDLGVDTMIMGWHRPSIAQETVAALARRLADEVNGTLAIYIDYAGTGLAPDGERPVLLLDEAVRPVAERLADAMATTVEQAAPDTITERPGVCVVAATSPSGRVFGADVEQLSEEMGIPVFAVRPARVPAAAGDARATA
jgi:Kef-type K+ transport system membrane component KefB